MSKDLDVFSIRDLRNRTGDLVKDAREGRLALITRYGKPALIALPFNQSLIEQGVGRTLAVALFDRKLVTLSQAARLAGISIEEFLSLLGESGIDAVDYPASELDAELEEEI